MALDKILFRFLMTVGSFLKKFGPLAAFFIILYFECYFLFIRDFENRFYFKPMLMPALSLFLFFGLSYSVNSHRASKIKFFLYLALVISWISDVLTVQATKLFLMHLSLAMYLLIYGIYILILYDIQKGYFSFFRLKKKVWITTLALLIGWFLFFNHFMGFHLYLYQILMYLAGFILVILVMLGLNLSNNKVISKIAYLFFIPCVILIVTTDILYFLDENLFRRRIQYSYLDSLVAFLHNISQLLMVLGVFYISKVFEEIENKEQEQLSIEELKLLSIENG